MLSIYICRLHCTGVKFSLGFLFVSYGGPQNEKLTHENLDSRLLRMMTCSGQISENTLSRDNENLTLPAVQYKLLWFNCLPLRLGKCENIGPPVHVTPPPSPTVIHTSQPEDTATGPPQLTLPTSPLVHTSQPEDTATGPPQLTLPTSPLVSSSPRQDDPSNPPSSVPTTLTNLATSLLSEAKCRPGQKSCLN